MNRITGKLVLALALTIGFSACGQTGKGDGSEKDKFQYTGYINDFENAFSPEEEHKLDSIVRSIEKASAMEIAVVTLDASMTSEAGFDSTTLFIAKKWGVGKKEKDNGILIGISKSMKKLRIQNGYGTSKILSDEETGTIMNTVMFPLYRKGDLYGGTSEGIIALYEKAKINSPGAK